MVCAIHGKHSHFYIGQAQSIQYAMMQHTTALGCCHVRLAPNNTCLVKWPVEPDIGFPVGFVTKKLFSCQQNQPFEEDVSYPLGWLSVIVRSLVQS
jgi:hypothetical protein